MKQRSLYVKLKPTLSLATTIKYNRKTTEKVGSLQTIHTEEKTNFYLVTAPHTYDIANVCTYRAYVCCQISFYDINRVCFKLQDKRSGRRLSVATRTFIILIMKDSISFRKKRDCMRWTHCYQVRADRPHNYLYTCIN